GADVAGRLAAEFNTVRIGRDNQDVVDRSDIVFLAIRPQIAEEVIRPLTFREDQSVVSLIAATDRERLLGWINVGGHLVQATPLPFVADRRGVTALFPADARSAEIFDVLGAAVQCSSKKEYDLLAAASATMSTYFGLMSFIAEWLATEGLDQAKARDYVASL